MQFRRAILRAENCMPNRLQCAILKNKGRIESYTVNSSWIEIITSNQNVPTRTNAFKKWKRELNLYRVKVIDYMAPRRANPDGGDDVK